MEVDYKALNDLIQQRPDLEHLSQEDVFRHLQSSPGGISSEDAGRRLQVFGSNKLEEKKENKFLKFLQFAWNPLTWAMEVAALLAIAHPNGGGKPPDWQDFVGIVMLLLIHSTINCIEENHASNAAAELLAFLSLKARVCRDGHWGEVNASIIVPGDIIRIKLGDIVPADVRLLEGDPLKIDQSAHTGESFPVFKGRAESVFSGSICMQGEIDAIVYATGIQTKSRDAHLVDSPNKQGRLQKVLIAIGNFCICTVALGLLIEIIVMYPIQKRSYRSGVNNLLVLLIGGIPIAMPTVLSVTMAITSHRLSQQGVITKTMTAIEDLAGIDVLCTNKTGTLTTNKLFVNKSLVDVFPGGESVERVILMAARASRLENPDAIDAAILETLLDPNEARAGVQEIHFLPFNPTEKRTALTYIDNEGRMCRASKGAPEEILNLVSDKATIQHRVQETINKFAEGGQRSLAVAYQEVPDRTKESPGGPWIFLGLIPLSNPSREDSAITIKKALRLGLQVKMITGDQLAIAKKAGDLLGLGVNMCTSSALFGLERDESITLPADVLIEEADGFASVLPEHKYEIVKRLQAKNHICGITGDGVSDAPALKIADIGIAVANATDAARDASDIVLTEPGLSVIISAVLICRAIFHRMKSYMIHAVSITICIVVSLPVFDGFMKKASLLLLEFFPEQLGFVFLTLIWKFDFPPFMVLIIAILNDGTIMVISKDRVKPCRQPDSWKLGEIFATGIALGSYLAVVTAVFFWAAFETNFFWRTFGVATLQRGSPDDLKKVASAVYLQVSTLSQALIFVTRANKWSLIERPGFLPVLAFLCTQMVATIIAVYANWEFAEIQGIGWKWAGVILLYNLVFYIPLDFIKLLVQYAMTGKAWDHLAEQKVAFMRKKDFGRDERERRWVLAQRNIGQPKITPAYLVWILVILGGIGLGYAVTAPANMVKFDEFIEQFWPTILKNKKKAVETDVCLYTNFWLILVSTGTPLCASPSVWIAWIVSCKWGRKCTVLVGSVSWVVGAGLIAIVAIWFTNPQILITGLCIQGFGVGALRHVIPMICGDYFPERRDVINTIFNYSYMSGTAIANLIYYLSAENLHSGWIIPTTVNVSFPILLFVIGILVREPPQQNGEIQPFWNVVIRPQLRDWTHFRNKPKVVTFVICQVLSSLVGVGSIVYVGPVLLESIKFTKRQSFLAPMVASFCGLGSFVLSDIFVYFGSRKWPVLLSYLFMGVTLTGIGITYWIQNINDELHLGVGDARLFIALSICAIIGFYIPGAPSSLTADRYYGESPYVGATFEASFRFLMTAMMGLAIFWIFCEMSFRAFLLMGCVGFLLGIFVGICVPETYRGVERDHIYDDIWRQHRIWKFVLPNTEEDLQA